MKEITLDNFKDEVKSVRHQEQKKQLKLLGSIRPKRGHTLFEVNLDTGDIIPAVKEPIDFVVGKKNSEKKSKVITKGNCIYISALNKRNVIKKINNHLKQ